MVVIVESSASFGDYVPDVFSKFPSAQNIHQLRQRLAAVADSVFLFSGKLG